MTGSREKPSARLLLEVQKRTSLRLKEGTEFEQVPSKSTKKKKRRSRQGSNYLGRQQSLSLARIQLRPNSVDRLSLASIDLRTSASPFTKDCFKERYGLDNDRLRKMPIASKITAKQLQQQLERVSAGCRKIGVCSPPAIARWPESIS